jgi:hypothetical protein
VTSQRAAGASVLIESEPKLQVLENALGNQRSDADRTDDGDRPQAKRQKLSRMIPGHRAVHLLPSAFSNRGPRHRARYIEADRKQLLVQLPERYVGMK